MKIGLWETFPLMESLLSQIAPLFPLAGSLEVGRWEKNESYHIFLTDRALPPSASSEIILIPSSSERLWRDFSGQVITGGMGSSDPVTFSSIGEDRALLCLQQEILFCGREIVPFERPVPFRRNFSLYKNLAVTFALSLTEILFGEEFTL